MRIQIQHIAVAIVAGTLFLFVPFLTAFFISLFLFWLIFRLDSRIIAGVAIVFLICIPILLSLGQDARAEQVAVYTYFLLAITVALQVIEFKRAPARGKLVTPARPQQDPAPAQPPQPRTADGLRLPPKPTRQPQHVPDKLPKPEKRLFTDILRAPSPAKQRPPKNKVR